MYLFTFPPVTARLVSRRLVYLHFVYSIKKIRPPFRSREGLEAHLSNQLLHSPQTASNARATSLALTSVRELLDVASKRTWWKFTHGAPPKYVNTDFRNGQPACTLELRAPQTNSTT